MKQSPNLKSDIGSIIKILKWIHKKNQSKLIIRALKNTLIDQFGWRNIDFRLTKNIMSNITKNEKKVQN